VTIFAQPIRNPKRTDGKLARRKEEAFAIAEQDTDHVRASVSDRDIRGTIVIEISDGLLRWQ